RRQSVSGDRQSLLDLGVRPKFKDLLHLLVETKLLPEDAIAVPRIGKSACSTVFPAQVTQSRNFTRGDLTNRKVQRFGTPQRIFIRYYHLRLGSQSLCVIGDGVRQRPHSQSIVELSHLLSTARR